MSCAKAALLSALLAPPTAGDPAASVPVDGVVPVEAVVVVDAVEELVVEVEF